MPATSYMYTDKVFTALDHAPAAFDLRGRILGPNGNNLDYIKSETGAVVFLKGGMTSSDPLHVVLQHSRTDGVSAARSLALNLIETVKNELQQWSSQTGQGVSAALPGAPEVPVSNSNTPEPPTQPVNIAPAVTAAPTNPSVVTVRQPTVLQLMPQQQYILNQDGSQLIPLIQPGQIPGQANFTQLIGSFPQNSNTTQFVDANMQPVSMAQFRLSGVPNSMPTIIQSGLPLPQVSLANQDSTTVSYTSLLPVSSAVSSPSIGPGPMVHAMQTGGQKVQWSSEKMTEKGTEVKYQYQVAGAEPMQLSMPVSGQTMYIPYHQLQELTGQSAATLQPQFVSISTSGGVSGWPAGASLPLQQISQLPSGASLNQNVLQLNQKTAPANTSVINLWPPQPGGASMPAQIAPAQQILAPQPAQIWSNQQMQIAASQGTTLTPIPPNTQWVRAPAVASAAELIPLNNPIKVSSGQEPRAQKRMSDGTPTQVQLRPIAPAGSHISQQEKSSGVRDSRPVLWTANTGREISGNSGNQMIQKVSNSRGPLPVISSNPQLSTGSITITARDGTSSPARQVDKNAVPMSQEVTAKPTESSSKVSTLPQNIQMYAVSSNGTPIQNITQMPSSIAQPNVHMNHMYLVSSSQGTGLQSVALPQNTMMGQTLQVGQGNVPMMQPNQLTLPQGVQYNAMPLMHLPQQMQYITSGLNLNNPATAHQLGLAMAGQQVLSPAMLANLQSSNPNQMAQLSQPIQGLHNQAAQSSQTAGNIQYNATHMQGMSQPAAQFITPNSQQQVVGNAYVSSASQFAGQPAQFATHQGNFVMPAQGNPQLQYNLVNQPISAATQMNSMIQPGESRPNSGNASQPSSYAANTPNTNQQNTFTTGVTQQNFPAGAQISQAPNQPTFPAVGSPGTNQQPPLSTENATNASVGNYSSGVTPNQGGNFQQSNTTGNSFPSSNASASTGQPTTFNGGQYSSANNSKAWPGPRFSGAPSNRPQFTVPARSDQPPPAPTPGAPSPTNPNYWQFS